MTATADSGAPGALFAAYLGEKRPQIEAFLAECAPACVAGTAEATRADLDRYLYQPLERFTASGGKRTRPALALLGCEAVGGDPAAALSTAAARPTSCAPSTSLACAPAWPSSCRTTS